MRAAPPLLDLFSAMLILLRLLSFDADVSLLITPCHDAITAYADFHAFFFFAMPFVDTLIADDFHIA